MISGTNLDPNKNHVYIAGALAAMQSQFTGDLDWHGAHNDELARQRGWFHMHGHGSPCYRLDPTSAEIVKWNAYIGACTY
jgi:hypothetical protein